MYVYYLLHYLPNYVLGILNSVATLRLASLLIWLCIGTRSKGLLVITTAFIASFMFGFIDIFVGQYINGGSINVSINGVSMTYSMHLYNLGKMLLHKELLILGFFLIYREWSRGEIHWRQDEASEEINAQ